MNKSKYEPKLKLLQINLEFILTQNKLIGKVHKRHFD